MKRKCCADNIMPRIVRDALKAMEKAGAMENAFGMPQRRSVRRLRRMYLADLTRPKTALAAHRGTVLIGVMVIVHGIEHPESVFQKHK